MNAWRCACGRVYGFLVRCPDCKQWAPGEPRKLDPVRHVRYRKG